MLLLWAAVLGLRPVSAQEGMGPDEVYQLGLTHFTSGKFADAIPNFEYLIDIFGNEPSLQDVIEASYYGLGCSQYNIGQYTESIATFRDYIKKFPSAKLLDEAMFRIASAHQAVEAYGDAVDAYRELLEKQPDSLFAEDAAFQLALCYMADENASAAAKAFAFFVETFPRSDLKPQAYVFMARSQLDNGDYKTALDTLVKVGEYANRFEHVVHANFIAMEIGDLAFEDTEYRLALKAFRRVRTMNSLIRLQERQIDRTEQQLAFLSRQRVRPSEVAEHFRKERRLRMSLSTLKDALEQLKETPDYDAGVFHRIGRCFYSIERLWEARTAYRRVIEEADDPVLQEAAGFDLILTLSRLRRFDELIAAADQYLDRFGDDPELIEKGRVPAVAFMRAESFLNREMFEACETEMANLMEVYPDHPRMPRIRFYHALSMAMQEKFSEAIPAFEEWLKDYPDHHVASEVSYWLPVSMFYDSRYEQAIPLLDAYVKAYPMSVYTPEAAYRSALCKYALERYGEAAEELDAWLINHPDHLFKWEARVTLGDALAAEGELERAEEAYRSVTAEAGPLHYLAINQLNKVYKALDSEEAYVSMAKVHIDYMQANPESPNMVESAFHAGWALRQLDRSDEARRLYWQTIKKFGDQRDWEGFQKLFGDLPLLYRDEPDGRLYADFVDAMEEAREEGHRVLLARLVKAELDNRGRDEAEIAEEMLRRFRIQEFGPELLAFLGNALVKSGDPAQGMTFLELLLEQHPNSMFADVAYARKAEALLASGNNEEALAYADIAVARATGPELMMEAVFVQGRALQALGRNEEALEAFRNVLASRATPQALKPEAMLAAAACHEAMDETAKAIPYYQRIYVMYRAYSDAVAEAYMRSARAFITLRDRASAINTYREMLNTESLQGRPELEAARKKLAELES